MKKILTIEQVTADPIKTSIDARPEDRVMLALNLVKTATKENIDAIVSYIMRPEFSKELELIVICEICARCPELMETPAFLRWAKANKTMGL